MKKYILSGLSAVLLVLLVQSSAFGAENKANIEAQAQLEINKTTLLSEGSTEKNRVNAAVLLLLSGNSQARDILLGALGAENSASVRIAVCQALKQSRGWEESIKGKDSFIEPLFGMLGSEDAAEDQVAAEALIIYDYKKIGGKLKQILNDKSASAKAKLNAVYAMRIRPDKDAILDMIELLGGEDAAVSAEAGVSLEKVLGIPVGADKSEWARITKELEKKNRDEFIADRLVMQYDKVGQLEEELAEWKKLYNESLNKFYDQIQDDAAKERFIVDQFGSDKVEVKKWAIVKVSQWKNSGKPLPELISGEILKLISSDDSEIRLESAKLSAGLGSAGPAELLLKQLKVEAVAAIRLEQFKSLGEVLYYGLLSGSNVEISNPVRIETLEIAGNYLDSNDLEEVISAARVIRKLLDQNGLENTVAQKYFGLLYNRYRLIAAEQDSYRGELVSVMSKLCQESSYYRVDATNIFRPLFEEGLGDSAGLVRGASIAGLENIDKAEALKIFREKKLYDDSVEAVRLGVYQLAGQVGGVEDLEWLSTKLNTNGDSEAGWKAFVEIINRSSFDQALIWVERLVGEGVKGDYLNQLILAVEGKSLQGGQELSGDVKRLLADVYEQKGEYDKSLGYLNSYIEQLQGVADDGIRAKLLEIYLKKQDTGAAVNQVYLVLKEEDLSAKSPVIDVLKAYIGDSAVDSDKKQAFVSGIIAIPAEQRPMWLEFCKSLSCEEKSKVEDTE